MFARGLLQTYSLAKQIVMTEKMLRNLSVFVSVALKHLNEIRRNQLIMAQ
jgi:hypothetical protein